jgi:hypothetical protein
MAPHQHVPGRGEAKDGMDKLLSDGLPRLWVTHLQLCPCGAGPIHFNGHYTRLERVHPGVDFCVLLVLLLCCLFLLLCAACSCSCRRTRAVSGPHTGFFFSSLFFVLVGLLAAACSGVLMVPDNDLPVSDSRMMTGALRDHMSLK